jgi:hypothetical protein
MSQTYIFARDAGDAQQAMTTAHLTIADVIYVVSGHQIKGSVDPKYLITKRFWDRPDSWELWQELVRTQTKLPDISEFPDSVQGILNGTGNPGSGRGQWCPQCGVPFYGGTKLCPSCNIKPTYSPTYTTRVKVRRDPDPEPEPKEFKHIKEPPAEKKRFKKIKP